MEERRPVETVDVETCTAALYMTVDLTHILLLHPGGHDQADKNWAFSLRAPVWQWVSGQMGYSKQARREQL